MDTSDGLDIGQVIETKRFAWHPLCYVYEPDEGFKRPRVRMVTGDELAGVVGPLLQIEDEEVPGMLVSDGWEVMLHFDDSDLRPLPQAGWRHLPSCGCPICPSGSGGVV